MLIRKFINTFFIIIAAGLILFSSVSLYLGFRNYGNSEQLYKETREKFVRYVEPSPVPDEEDSSKPAESSAVNEKADFKSVESDGSNRLNESDETNKSNEYTESGENTQLPLSETSPPAEGIQVNLTGLQALNPDIIGWLYVENTEISYPLLYSGDDQAYLRHGYDGSALNAGSIFLRGANAPDLSDNISVIYGHDTLDGTMFGRLTDFGNAGYLDAHSCFRIILPGVCYRYQIDRCGIISSTDSLYATTNDGSNLKRVVLSTCHGDSQRFIVSGTLTEVISM